MSDKISNPNQGLDPPAVTDRRVRTDAQRNLDTLLQSAKAVFATSGVDAPVREIAENAGVGIATIYRHFPKRSDLIAAVFRREIDECADAAVVMAEALAPGEALSSWMQRYTVLIITKRGLAPALHSGDPAYGDLRGHFEQRVRPALRSLVKTAVEAGDIRGDVDADDILSAVSSLCMSPYSDKPERMVALFFDGLRFGARPELQSTNARD